MRTRGFEVRSPKSEGRKKAEFRNPKTETRSPRAIRASVFGFRPSFGLRPSGFGFDPLLALLPMEVPYGRAPDSSDGGRTRGSASEGQPKSGSVTETTVTGQGRDGGAVQRLVLQPGTPATGFLTARTLGPMLRLRRGSDLRSDGWPGLWPGDSPFPRPRSRRLREPSHRRSDPHRNR